MKYKLMAVDIDGTLLDSDSNLTEETRKAIRLGVEKGLIFTIASGRPIQGVEKLNEQLNLDLPFITYNGAMVVMGKSKRILYEQKLSPVDSKSIYELGEKYGAMVIIWNDNKLYVNKMNDNAKQYSDISKTEPILITDIDETVKNGATKALWFDDVALIDKWEHEVGRFLSDSITYHTSRPYFLEFVDKKASKALAMEKIGEIFGISRDEMIAVGDGINDLSMIEYAGLGIAMANAKDAVKEKAGYITLSNDEDGVAHVIYKFILGDEEL